MVQVAQTRPVLATVVVGAQRPAIAGCPIKRRSAVIVTADVGGEQLVGHTLVSLVGESHPVANALAVVDHHIGDGTDALIPEGVDHRQQLHLGAEGTGVVVKPILGVIAHRVIAAATGALRNPHQAEEFGELIGLRLQIGPLAVVVGVPIESLQHHAPIARGPPLPHHHHGQHYPHCNCNNPFHCP